MPPEPAGSGGVYIPNRLVIHFPLLWSPVATSPALSTLLPSAAIIFASHDGMGAPRARAPSMMLPS